MATLNGKRQVFEMDEQEYKVFTSRVKGNLSKSRKDELRNLGKAMSKIQPLQMSTMRGK